MEDIQLDELQWRSPEWIQAYGLRTDNVLDYFALSPFYDRSSNNQVLKMQTEYNERLQGRTDIQKELQTMKGIAFVIAIAQEPDLWVIRKQNRRSATEVDILDTYFIVGENIYMAPSVHSILSSRLLATSRNLAEALKAAETLPTFSPTGYSYVREEKSNDDSAASAEPEEKPETKSVSLDRAFAVSLGNPNYI